MTLQAKGTCPRLDDSYQSICYDGSGGTRHICSRNSLVGVPGYSTTTKDNWTTVFWSNQQGKGPQRDQKWKWVWFLLPHLKKMRQWHWCTVYKNSDQIVVEGGAHLTSKQPQGLSWLPQRTSPSHYSHGILLITQKVTNNSKILFVFWDFSMYAMLGHLDKICSRLNPRPLHHIDSMEF